MRPVDKMLKLISKHPLWTMGIAIVLLFGSTILFVQPLGIVVFDAHTGVIGDTIGGITAPIIGLLGIILVFLSFEAQREANVQQRAQLDLQMILALYEDWKKEIDSLEPLIPADSVKVSLSEDWTNLDRRQGSLLKRIEAFMMSQRILVRTIRDSALINEHKLTYLTKVTYYYTSHIRSKIVPLLRWLKSIADTPGATPDVWPLIEVGRILHEVDAETSPHLSWPPNNS